MIAAKRLTRRIERFFFADADPRAYAALRIGFAVGALGVWGDLWGVRHVLLAETGLFGGSASPSALFPLDVFAWARTEAAVTAVMLVGAVAITFLGLGVYQRGAAIVTYVWAASYSAAVPVALGGFDQIVRLVAFILMISPTTETWALAGRRKAHRPVPIYGLRLVQFQLLLIYASTVALKVGDPFWLSGEAVGYFLLSMFARFPDPAVADAEWLTMLATYATLVVEALVVPLLWWRTTRWSAIALGAALHLAIGLTSRLMLFTLMILPMYAAFLEARDFAQVREWARKILGKARAANAG